MLKMRFCREMRSARRPSRSASGTLRRSSAMRATSAASMAASVPPLPMAMPRSARGERWRVVDAVADHRDRAELVRAAARSASTFCSGRSSASTSSMSQLGGDRLGGALVVAAQHREVTDAEAPQRGDRFARLRSWLVAHRDQRERPVAFADDRHAVFPPACSWSTCAGGVAVGESQLDERRGLPTQKLLAVDARAWRRVRRAPRSPRLVRTGSPSCVTRSTIARASGCFERASTAAARASASLRVVRPRAPRCRSPAAAQR